MKKKWLLINPPTGKYIRDTRCQSSVSDIFAIYERPPIDLAYIAGAISQNDDECIIRDYSIEGLRWDDYKNDISNNAINYIVINTTMSTYKADLVACKMAKDININIITIAKGAIFFYKPNLIMNEFPFLDISVSAEEEEAFNKLSLNIELKNIDNICYRNNGEIITNSQSFKPVLNLPAPRIELINHNLYRRPDTNEKQATIVVERGCPGKCVYCIAPVVGGHKDRYRDIKEIIKEIKIYYYNYCICNFYFCADTFTWNKKWVFDFCNEIIKLEFKISWLCTSRIDCISYDLLKAMKSAGCWGLSIGIESVNEEIQKHIKKGLNRQQIIDAIKLCRKFRLVCLTHFIIGFPWDNKNTILETISFARKLKANIIEFYIASPLPGTELYNIVKEKNDSKDYIDGVTNIEKIGFLTEKELIKLRNKALRSIYLNPLFYFNSLAYMKSFSEFIRCAKFIIKKVNNIILRNIIRKN